MISSGGWRPACTFGILLTWVEAQTLPQTLVVTPPEFGAEFRPQPMQTKLQRCMRGASRPMKTRLTCVRQCSAAGNASAALIYTRVLCDAKAESSASASTYSSAAPSTASCSSAGTPSCATSSTSSSAAISSASASTGTSSSATRSSVSFSAAMSSASASASAGTASSYACSSVSFSAAMSAASAGSTSAAASASAGTSSCTASSYSRAEASIESYETWFRWASQRQRRKRSPERGIFGTPSPVRKHK